MSEVRPILLRVPEEMYGDQVVLRPFKPDDAEALFEAIEESREHLTPWMAWPRHHQSVDDTRVYIIRQQALWLLRESLTVGIFEKGTGRLLGGTGFHEPNWQLRSFEIGYWIRAGAEGHGYVTDAVCTLTRVAFDELGAYRVAIMMDTRNLRSRAVPERLGFLHEATLRNDAADVYGELRDTHVYALTPDSYAQVPWRRV